MMVLIDTEHISDELFQVQSELYSFCSENGLWIDDAFMWHWALDVEVDLLRELKFWDAKFFFALLLLTFEWVTCKKRKKEKKK